MGWHSEPGSPFIFSGPQSPQLYDKSRVRWLKGLYHICPRMRSDLWERGENTELGLRGARGEGRFSPC